jgi:hypothetical protein
MMRPTILILQLLCSWTVSILLFLFKTQRLIRQAKFIYQDQKDFNIEIKNIRHDLMLNEYPQEFVDSIMKPSRSNRPSSDIIHQGTVIIPYVKSISEKFRRIVNRFNIRTIFETKRSLRGTLMKTGPI